MMKCKIVFLLFISLIVYGNVFSQAGKIEYDSLRQMPYEFMVNKTKFRLIVYDTSHYYKSISIEKYNSSWEMIDSIDSDFHVQLKDINNDGYLDLGASEKRELEVWFFNPFKNIFVNSGEYSIYELDGDSSTRMHLIDKNKSIYYDYSSYKWGEEFSNLFQIKDYKRIDLGLINNETKYSEKDSDYLTTTIMINKILNDDLYENIKLIKKIKWNKDFDDFDYASYWQANWKNFLKN